ncbi:MAG: hypothetical protein ONB11_06680, partial [candidate division KSB1 bacterium]|nr:hypothetical protein [candidate division KSB1 bacterium]
MSILKPWLLWIMMAMVANVSLCVTAARMAAADEVMNLQPLGKSDYLPGFVQSLAGQSIDYYSPHSDVRTALLCRATDGKMLVEWETAPLPADYRATEVSFIWIAGLGCNIAEKKFDLFIDGRYCLTFTSTRVANWSLKGKNDAELSFQTLMTDQYGDRFGYMYLKLPVNRLSPNQPLRLKVVGEPAGSNAWFMIFQERLEPKVTFHPELILQRSQNRLFQNVRLHIVNLNQPLPVRIYSQQQVVDAQLNFGFNAVTLPFEAVEKEQWVEIHIETDGQKLLKKRLLLQPVRRFDVHLLPHSHLDIGYTHLQDDVLKMQFKNLENAIHIAENSQNYPPEARFKWNVEQFWHVDEYLKRQDAASRARLIEAIRQGWIGLDGLYANILTGLCRGEELFEALSAARGFSNQYHLPIESAMISDIPGWTWGLVPALAKSGIKYLSLGPNLGHRIGHVFDWADQPFYWLSPSGEEQVLCWVHGKGYSWFHTGLDYIFSGQLDASRVRFERILPYLEDLVHANYPYNLIGLRYSIGSDNGPPDEHLPDLVAQWNEKYESPRLIISTTAQLFRALEERYRDNLPRVRGDFTPYWEDGAASTARETAMNRAASERLLQASALWTMLNRSQFPHQAFEDAWRQVLLFSEHTWGAWNSISAPDDEAVQRQWQWKQQRAIQADALSRELIAGALQHIKASDERVTAIAVFNTNNWSRTDLVTLPRNLILVGDVVKDQSGATVPSQRLSSGELVFLAQNVPALGSKLYALHRGKSFHQTKIQIATNKISNDLLTVEIGVKTGAIVNLQSKSSPHNYADLSQLAGLNDYIYVQGRSPHDRRQIDGPIRITVLEKGPLVAALMIESSAPGCNRLRRVVQLVHGLPRVDIIDELDRPLIRTPEGIHLGFPFNVPSGKIRIQSPWAVVQPEQDQLRGACRNWFTVQHWVDISNDQLGITLVPIDAPLIEIGDLHADATVSGWLRTLEPSPTVYSYIMNNYWETNYKAEQPGITRLRYSLIPHGTFDQPLTERIGIE